MKWSLGSAVVLCLCAGGCEVRECDRDTEDCSFEDDDAGTDGDDGGGETCDFETWDRVEDDLCLDDTTVETCEAGDVLRTYDCEAVCEKNEGTSGTCDVLEEGGFGCVCAAAECDFETWSQAEDDTCADETTVQSCAAGDVFDEIDCVAECQKAIGEDGVCATLLEDPGFGCVCGTGETCDGGTPDACLDVDTIERCVAGIVIEENCGNWCRSTGPTEDGVCETDECVCF